MFVTGVSIFPKINTIAIIAAGKVINKLFGALFSCVTNQVPPRCFTI